MRAIDRTLSEAVAARPGWVVVREGVMIWKRPAAMLMRHAPFVAEIRADRRHFVVWLRLRAGKPVIAGGDWASWGSANPGRGPAVAASVDDAFAVAEGWYDRQCSEMGCQEHPKEGG